MVLFLPIKFLAPLDIASANLGVALAVAIYPLCVVSVRAYRWGVVLLALIWSSAVAGLLLAYTARSTHEVANRTVVSMTATIISLGITFAAILWARQHLSTRTIVLLYAAGATINAAFTPTLWSTNPLKYAFGGPIMLILLALAYNSRRRWPTLAALTLVAVLSVRSDSRLLFGCALITAAAFLWRWNRESVPTRVRSIWGILGVVVVGYGVYSLVIGLALNGQLGERNQLVTGRQNASNQSVLTSSRPEWGGALGLFAHRPFGFGPGVVPNTQEVDLGESGIRVLNPSTSQTYLSGYLFDGRIELHSVISDLWVNFGLVGLALSIAITLILVRYLKGLLASRSPPALPIMLCITALWDLGFSPIATNLPAVIFTVALLLPQRAKQSGAPRRTNSSRAR